MRLTRHPASLCWRAPQGRAAPWATASALASAAAALIVRGRARVNEGRRERSICSHPHPLCDGKAWSHERHLDLCSTKFKGEGTEVILRCICGLGDQICASVPPTEKMASLGRFQLGHKAAVPQGPYTVVKLIQSSYLGPGSRSHWPCKPVGSGSLSLPGPSAGAIPAQQVLAGDSSTCWALQYKAARGGSPLTGLTRVLAGEGRSAGPSTPSPSLT